jgi:hypothetical protein
VKVAGRTPTFPIQSVDLNGRRALSVDSADRPGVVRLAAVRGHRRGPSSLKPTLTVKERPLIAAPSHGFPQNIVGTTATNVATLVGWFAARTASARHFTTRVGEIWERSFPPSADSPLRTFPRERRRRQHYSECRCRVGLWLETKLRQSPLSVLSACEYGRPRLSRGDSGDPMRMGRDPATSRSAGSVAIS